ncbi:MAG: translesion DNA synthesis-associated protein ImuA [Gammaproteobacteria bacterium]
MIATALEDILARRDVWRGTNAAWAETLPSGFASLDARLGGGWPLGTLIECFAARPGSGEVALYLPALARVTASHAAAFVAPPQPPYAPALTRSGVNLSRLLIIDPDTAHERLWATAQSLASGACRMLLFWTRRLDGRALRQLLLAAEGGRALAVLFRPLVEAGEPSPAALRLVVEPDADAGAIVNLLKCRGRPACAIHLHSFAPA